MVRLLLAAAVLISEADARPLAEAPVLPSAAAVPPAADAPASEVAAAAVLAAVVPAEAAEAAAAVADAEDNIKNALRIISGHFCLIEICSVCYNFVYTI